ncbi:MAG: flagellar basal-body rod protein FlgG [Polyangiaceae bacterium]
MFRSLNIAATGMTAQETKLDTIANNLANANTAGYKKQEAEFEDLLYQTQRGAGASPLGAGPTRVQIGSGARIVATPRLFSQGSIQQTGNPLDVAIEGNGFFVVNREDGTQAFTRAGALKLGSDGRIMTSDGLPLDPSITVPLEAQNVVIGSDGRVTAEMAGQAAPVELGKIQLATFANPGGLSAVGHNLFVPSPSSGEPAIGDPATDARGRLMQGAVEGSNVEVVDEMIGLVRTQRAYEINSKVIAAADEMLRSATQLR